MGSGVHRNSGIGNRRFAGLHRDGRPDRVSLVDRFKSARVPFGTAERADAADGRREIRSSGGKGSELRALRSEGAAVNQPLIPSRKWSVTFVALLIFSCR